MSAHRPGQWLSDAAVLPSHWGCSEGICEDLVDPEGCVQGCAKIILTPEVFYIKLTAYRFSILLQRETFLTDIVQCGIDICNSPSHKNL